MYFFTVYSVLKKKKINGLDSLLFKYFFPYNSETIYPSQQGKTVVRLISIWKCIFLLYIQYAKKRLMAWPPYFLNISFPIIVRQFTPLNKGKIFCSFLEFFFFFFFFANWHSIYFFYFVIQVKWLMQPYTSMYLDGIKHKE